MGRGIRGISRTSPWRSWKSVRRELRKASIRDVTAKNRDDLARKMGHTGSDHLIIRASNFDVLELVLLDKRARQQRGPVGGGTVRIIPRTVMVNRKGNNAGKLK